MYVLVLSVRPMGSEFAKTWEFLRRATWNLEIGRVVYRDAAILSMYI